MPHGHGLSTYRRTLLHSPSSERLARPLVRQPVGRSQKGIRRLPNAGSGQPGSIATVIYRISLCTDHLACRVTAEDGLEMSWFPGPSWQHGRHSAERQRQLCDFSSKAFFLTDRITFGSLTAGRSKASLRSAVIRFTVAFLAKLRPQKLFEAAPASARSCFSAASSSCRSRDSRSCALLDATLRIPVPGSSSPAASYPDLCLSWAGFSACQD